MSFSQHLEALLGHRSGRSQQNETLEALAELDRQFGELGITSSDSTEVDDDDLLLDQDPVLNLLGEGRDTREDFVRDAGVPQALGWLRSALSGIDKFDEALSILTSPSSDSDISEPLLEIFGFDGIENVSRAIERRGEIIREKNEAGVSNGTAPSLAGPQTNGAVASKMPAAAAEHYHPLGDSQSQSHLRPYLPTAQLSFMTAQEREDAKRVAKDARKAAARSKREAGDGNDALHGYSYEQLEAIKAQNLVDNANRPLVVGTGARLESGPVYPHVYSSSQGGNLLSFLGTRFALPEGTTKTAKENYEEIVIPTPQKLPMRSNERLIKISELDGLARGSFPGYESLNRLQSIVYPIAYETNENMLVCAPTGAGKTDVAMLTVLRAISQSTHLTKTADGLSMSSKDFKIIYVAPMKALAAEIVRKLGKRLKWLGVVVKELTGDMQLTRAEIAETQVIVTTPEKWDVVTRKATGEGELASKVRLLIIDEVHLLHDERGSVIESIIARTLRRVESSQSLIRIVALSATLPNYLDVADFCRVNPYQGLFFFDSSFRPVPLEQHFIGVKGKPGSPQSRENLDQATFDKVSELVQAGHPVMVFVHARKETVKTAQMLREKAIAEGIIDLFDPTAEPKHEAFRKDVAGSKNKELRDLFKDGLGIHHAGMLRVDRTLSERLFENNLTKVLVCTATLAWGVNLPAYAVVIKGTQIYDAGKGSFVDLSILDVLQIFGRAGRPQYETHGVGFICTTHDRLDHYVSAITQQHPIESKFVDGMVDSLNAEIALGTVSNVDEGVRWIGYTFLFVRMRKNPMAYGIDPSTVRDDPYLGSKRNELIVLAARRLATARMIIFDEDLRTFTPTDQGRIASRYYLRNASVEVFNQTFRSNMNEADALSIISSSVEFDQITVRDSEQPELNTLAEQVIPCQVKGGPTTTQGKVNILLQSYISRAYIEDFALVSDQGYVAQNAGRIARALLDISLSKRWASTSATLISMCKSIEKRMWGFDHPLSQFDLPANVLHNIQEWADDYEVVDLASMTPADLGNLIHMNERLGGIALKAARQFPHFVIRSHLQPLAHDLLRIRLQIERDFDWSDKVHGRSEPFWLWVEDDQSQNILQMASLMVRSTTKIIRKDFIIPLQTLPPSLNIRLTSDRWLGAEDLTAVDLSHLVMPPPPPPHTPLLDLPLLAIHNLGDDALRSALGSLSNVLGPVETEVFHTLYHSHASTIVCSPLGSRQDLLLDIPLLRAFRLDRDASCLLLVPDQHSLRHVCRGLQSRWCDKAGVSVLPAKRLLVAGASLSKAIIVATPTSILDLLRSGADLALLRNVHLTVAQGVHAMTPAFEIALSEILAMAAEARIIAFASPLMDVSDLSTWLGIRDEHVFSFHPSSRSFALSTSFQTFSIPHSAALLAAMVKPACAVMKIPDRTTICFVPSKGQCRATLRDMVKYMAADLDSTSFITQRETLEMYAEQVRDVDLREGFLQGIGMFHDGMSPDDQKLTLLLFKTRALRTLVVDRESSWTLPATADIVIVMSAQYAVLGDENERQIADYPLADLLQMQSLASSGEGTAEFLVMCQTDQEGLLSRFLLGGVPLHSDIIQSTDLSEFVLLAVATGRVRSRTDILDFLSWTYFYRQRTRNPAYFSNGLPDAASTLGGDDEVVKSDLSSNEGLSRYVDRLIKDLVDRSCLRTTGQEGLVITELGREIVRNIRLSSHALDPLMKLGYEKAVDIVLANRNQPSQAGMVNGDGLDTDALKVFHDSLSAEARERIKLASDGVPAQDDEVRIFVSAFFARRVPPSEALAKRQAAVVLDLLKGWKKAEWERQRTAELARRAAYSRPGR